MQDQDLIDIRDVAPAEVGEIDLYQRREKIYTRKIEGFFQRIRLFTGWPLLLGYFLLPWLNWDGRQAILFDLPARKFHILGLTFWPQDFPLLAFLLIIAAFIVICGHRSCRPHLVRLHLPANRMDQYLHVSGAKDRG